jgi:hypothetical protein
VTLTFHLIEQPRRLQQNSLPSIQPICKHMANKSISFNGRPTRTYAGD